MLSKLLMPEIESLIAERKINKPKEILSDWTPADIADLIVDLPEQDKVIVFRVLPVDLATDTFEHLEFDTQEELLKAMGNEEAAAILNDMSPDDRTALLEELPGTSAKRLIQLLSAEERKVAQTLLGYPENSVGRLMTPDYIAVNLHDDQEAAVELFKKYDRVALPVIDNHGILIGIVTVDDVLDVAEEEATEDIQKIAGVSALEEPFPTIPIFSMVRKRAIWLTILFVAQILTAIAMGFFGDEISKAVVLSIFLPLVISSGGNSGSQAATLVIRAMAVGEIVLSDWWLIMRREIISGFMLGSILGIIGV